MKGKGLKLWQAIVLIFSSICLVSGGVVLYTYLTSGFGSKIVEAEKIEFDRNLDFYNSALDQLEVDGDFSLTVNATNQDVTETELTLSFAKSTTGQKLETYVFDGVTYISNGIISIPQKATIGQPIPVKVDKVTYNYDIGSFDANAGGITTILAKSSNILDAEGSKITVAVDVPVEKIALEVLDTTTGKLYPINSTTNISKILQNTNFDIKVKFYPTQSQYRYSDISYESFYGVADYVERTKDYCYEISSGEDVVMNYNGGNVYFSTTSSLTAGNKVNVYAFATAKKQEEFENSSSASLEGEYYYNAMLSFLAKNADGTGSVLTNTVNFSIEQADVGNMYVLNTAFEGKTNKLFVLTAKNRNIGNGTLDLNISNEDGEDLASMISQVALRVRYKKAGDIDFTDLRAGDNTVVIKSQDRILLGNNYVDNPYLVKNGEGEEDDVYYYFSNTAVKDLKNSYWEFSTNESSIVIEVTAVLFRTVDSVTSIFDINGDNLAGTQLSRTALITFTENQEAEGDVSWLSTNEQLNIVYHGTVQIPTQIELSKLAQIPSTNTYQKVQYYIAKADGTEITTDEANIVEGETIKFDGVTYALLNSSDLLFKKAGSYYVMFATVRTDAYGNIVDSDLETEGVQIKIEKKPQTPMTVVVNETLQSFQDAKITLTQANTEKYGVFKEVDASIVLEDMADGETKTYYTKNETNNTYATATILTPNTVQYYELLYYAIETGALDAITLEITVSESDTKMIEEEISKEKLKFYAVSADGMTRVELTVPTDEDVLSGFAEESVIKLPLSFPETTITGVDGMGKGFYIVTQYDNSVEVITTEIEVEDFAKTVKGENDKEFNCFMLYTPSAKSIKAPTYSYTPAGSNEATTRTLGELALDAEISMNNQAKYTTCKIKEGVYEVQGVKNGEEWLNDLLKETKVFDAYNREYTKNIPGSSSVYRVSASTTAAVLINNNEIKFASGKDKVTITVSAGANVNYSFVLNTNSHGLGSVTVGTTVYTISDNFFYNEDGEAFNNPFYNMVGEASKKIDFYGDNKLIYIGVGEYSPMSASYPQLDEAYTYYYLDPEMIEKTDLLEMFRFNDESGNKITKIDHETPIASFSIVQHFATNTTIKFVVSSKDYSDDSDTSPAAISFPFTINISQHESASVNFNDSFIHKDEIALSDGLYAGATYDINQLVDLTRGDWRSGTYGARTQYISEHGTLSIYPSETDIGTLADGTLTLYDVASLKNDAGVDNEYIIKLFYFNSNIYAYNTEIKFKIYPNVKFKVINDTLNYIQIANGELDNVSNHVELERIRGNLSIADVKIQMVSNSEVVVINSSQQFAYSTTKTTLTLGYNQYEKAFSVGAYVDGKQVVNAEGNNVVSELKLSITNDLNTFLEDMIYIKDKGATLGKATPVNFDEVEMLKVLSQTSYDVNESKHSAGAEAYYIDVINANYRAHTFNSGSIYFNPAPSGYLAGQDYYLNVYVYGVTTVTSGTKDDSKIIISLQVPVYVSGVGSATPYYFNYNEKVEGFDLNTLVSGEIQEEEYATFKAGQNVQIAYVDNGYSYLLTSDKTINPKKTYYTFDGTSYTKVAEPTTIALSTYYELKRAHEGIYYDDGYGIELSFDKDFALDQIDYAKLIIQGETYRIQFANLANEERVITLYAKFSNGRNSVLTYVYKIKVLPNVETTVTYPFSEDSENGAEYISSESSTEIINVDFADVLGQNAGAKADKTRFNLVIKAYDELSRLVDIDISEKKDYYISAEDLIENEDGSYMLNAGTMILNQTDETVFTIYEDILLSGIGETIEVTHPTLGTLDVTEIYFTTVNYSIKEISVGGNGASNAEQTGAQFENFAKGQTQHLTLLDVSYSVAYTVVDGANKFVISANGEVIGQISFTNDGSLTITKLNNNYFINLVIEKAYSNIVNSTSTYKYYINNTAGIYYIDYITNPKDDCPMTDVVLVKHEDLQYVSTTISTDANFKLRKLYKTGEGSSSAEEISAITYNATLKDRNGNVVDLSNAIEGGTDGIAFTADGPTQWPYNLSINIKQFIDQNYTLELYFIARVGNDSFEISKFVIAIKGSLVATANVEYPTLNAGTIISATSIMSQYEFTIDGTNETIALKDIENVSDFNYIKSSNFSIVAMRQGESGINLELVLETSEGTSYITLPFNIAPNIAPVAQVVYENVPGRVHYAGQTGIIELENFYTLVDGTGLGDGNFVLSYKVPTTYEDYIDSISISGTNVEFKTNNVANDVNDVKIDLTFTYTFETYTFEISSTFVFDILSNSSVVVTYPDPDADGTSVEYESVYFNDEYETFFNSQAPFASGVYTVVESPVVANIGKYYELVDGKYEKTTDATITDGKTYYTANFNRVQITDLTGADPVDLAEATVTIKQTYGVIVYVGYEFTTAPADLTENYYTYNGTSFTQATSFSATTTYYLKKAEPGMPLDEAIIEGLEQTIVFIPYASYEDGYVIFEIEYKAVKEEYKVYAFKEIVEPEIVNTVTSMNGTEEIFLEYVEEGNILAENTVAKINMDPVLPSGTYYIKLNNPSDTVNPYHWVGFKYDMTKGNKIYVYLGEVADLNDETLKGYVLGLYSSKTAAVDLRKMEGTTTTLSLTSFVNLKYVTVSGNSKTTQEINRDYDYTAVIEAWKDKDLSTESEYALQTIIYKVENSDGTTSYYTKDGEELTEITDIDSILTQKILLGQYQVYDDYVTLEDNSKVLVTKSNETILVGDNGFGQGVDYVGELNESTDKLYKYGDDVYFTEDNVDIIYKLSDQEEGVNIYSILKENASIVFNDDNLQMSPDLENINYTGKTVVYDDEYAYFVNVASTKYPEIVVYSTGFEDSRVDFVNDFTVIEGKYSLQTFTDSATSDNATFKTFEAYIKDGYEFIDLFESTPATSWYIKIKAPTAEMYNRLKNSLYTKDGENYIKEASANEFQEGTVYYINLSYDANKEIYFFANDGKTYMINKQYDGAGNVTSCNAVEVAMKTFYVYAQHCGESTNITIKQNNGIKAAYIGEAETKIYSQAPTGTKQRYSLRDLSFDGTEDNGTKYVLILNAKYALGKNHYDSFDGESYKDDFLFNGNTINYTAKLKREAQSELSHGEYFMTSNDFASNDYLSGDSCLIKDSSGNYYIANVTKENLKNPQTIVLQGNYNVYKAESKAENVTIAVEIEELEYITINEIVYYKVTLANGSNVYVEESQINTWKNATGSEFYVANLETFTINDLTGLKIDDEVTLGFEYILGTHVGKFEFKFKLKLDLEVQNALESDNANENVETFDVSISDTENYTFNYIEIETNKEYNFNELVGVVRPSSGDILAPEDVRTSANMSIEIVNVGEIDNSYPSAIQALKGNLGEELKDNSDVIRFSYELVRSNNKDSGVVYNFNLTPLGADNNGDYILVKYSYEVSVGSYKWSELETNRYVINEYVLFKILPDYNVAINDTNGNPVLVTDANGTLNNLVNPIEITDFESGEICEKDKISEIAGSTYIIEEFEGTNYYLINNSGGNGTITYQYGYGKAYETDIVEGQYTSLTFTDSEGNKNYYLVKTADIDKATTIPGKSYLALVKVDAKLYVNVNLPISTTTDGSMLVVTASNAINSKKNIATSVFTAKVESRETYSAKYIEAVNTEGLTTEDSNLIGNFTKGVQLRIPNAVSLGERRYKATFVDKFGYTIELYFNLVALSNPSYASGNLEYIEGHTFDIGAQYEIVSVGSYHVQDVEDDMSNAVFYPITFAKGDKIPAGTYYSFYSKGEGDPKRNPDDVPIGSYYEQFITDSKSGANRSMVYFYSDNNLYFMEKVYLEETTVTSNTGIRYYKLLNGIDISNTKDSYTQFNMPYGYRDNTGALRERIFNTYSGKVFTTIYLSASEFILLESERLTANADSILTSVGSPNTSATTVETYDGTIVLGGINAFGFADKYIDGGDTTSRYFQSTCDLENLKVTKVEYKYDGYLLFSETKNNTIASTEDVYEYSSEDGIGRYINQEQYTIPTMPGWVYGDKDYAYVDLVITITSTASETYSLPITIRVTKADERIISTSSKASNVSDDTAFKLTEHVETNEKEFNSSSFYDDTVAVTLPATGSVKVNVEAFRNATTYYNKSKNVVSNIAIYDKNDLYYLENGEYFKAYFSGSTVLASSFGDMDFTYYVGLSRTVGHTLDPNFDVTITFTEYNTTLVTRDGNLGFYASYGYDTSKIETTGNDRIIGSSNAAILDDSDSSTWSYVYGYGQIALNGNRNEFTLLEQDGIKYYVPTESIVLGTSGANDVIKAGCGYVAEENRTTASTNSKTLKVYNESYSGSLLIVETKWASQEYDKLNLVDMGSLTNGALKITKYYIVKSSESDGYVYQFVKDYNVYPKYFDFDTDDVNHRVQAEANETSSTSTYTFDLSSWGDEVSIKTYNDSAEIVNIKLNGDIEIDALHFELGEEDTTNAKIDASTGRLSVNASKYNLNGEEYVTIKIYVKASGEKSTYISDKISTNIYSGNRYNTPMITVRVYLNANTAA